MNHARVSDVSPEKKDPQAEAGHPNRGLRCVANRVEVSDLFACKPQFVAWPAGLGFQILKGVYVYVQGVAFSCCEGRIEVAFL